MAGSKQRKLVTFNIEPHIWCEFLHICKSHDISGSHVLRNYVNLIVDGKLNIMDKKLWEHPKAPQPGP